MTREENKKVARYVPTCQEGLNTEQVEARIQEGLVNYDTDIPTKSVGRIIRDNVCTLFNFINAILAVAVLLVGSYKNLLFMGVVLCNMVIGIVQEVRAKRTIDRLSILSSTKAKVVRNSQIQEVSIHDVVLDCLLYTSESL